MGRIAHRPAGRGWAWAAGAGLALFLLIQVWPAASDGLTGGAGALSRSEAKRLAVSEATGRFGIPAGQIVRAEITHMSASGAVGYLSKENLLRRYEKEWGRDYPTDVYRADVDLANGGRLTLLLHMESGRLAGWRDERPALPAGEQDLKEKPEEAARRALAFASQWGQRPDDWEWDGKAPDAENTITFRSRKKALGEARLELHVRAPSGFRTTSSAKPPWQNGSVTYDFRLPASFTAYLSGQQKLAEKLNVFGFVVPQLALLVLAIGYAAARREYTSFRRGILLTLTFFALYAGFYANMQPAFRAGLLEQGVQADRGAVTAVMIVNLIVLAGMALFTYFAAVGGDGLWRSMGRSLWPRWRNADYGTAVLRSMKRGYLLAFVLLGVQSVILVGLERTIGMFQSSDAAQSTYNMTYPWLLLLLAWCAGISEELQSRFFGIGLFRSWLLGGAQRLLGRKPSGRAEAALTLAAMLPPGLVWAFGHVGYAVYPAYSRLIELVLMGVLFGLFLLRFGLMTVIFAHVAFDSILMSVQMAFDGLPGDPAAALIGVCLPAVVGYAIWLLHSRLGPGRVSGANGAAQ